MRNKKVDVLFFTMENCREDFFLFLRNENFNIIQKNCFSKEESFDDLRVIFVDFSFLCAFDFSIIMEIRKKFYWAQIIVISEEESVCFAVQSIKFGAEFGVQRDNVEFFKEFFMFLYRFLFIDILLGLTNLYS